jgi:hypothetical protein
MECVTLEGTGAAAGGGTATAINHDEIDSDNEDKKDDSIMDESDETVPGLVLVKHIQCQYTPARWIVSRSQQARRGMAIVRRAQ